MSAKILRLFPDAVDEFGAAPPKVAKKAKTEKPVDPFAHVVTSPHFEKAWLSFPKKGRLRSSKTQAFAEWKRVAPKVGKDALVSAVEKYAREDEDARGDGGPPAFHRWLKWGRWEHWLPDPEQAAVDVARRFPDATIRTKVVAALGEPWAFSWLDGCTYDGVLVVCPRDKATNIAKLLEARLVLRDLGIEYVAR